ncbi:MAG: hypothetical protein ACR2HJ_01730 [Fimbriimonadales bacterium]
MAFTPEELVGGLGISIVMALATAAWVITIVYWMLEGEIDSIKGAIVIAVALSLLPLGIWPPFPWLTALVLLCMIVGFLFVPFARSVYGTQMHRMIDTDELEKAYAAFGRDPGNVGARFEIARVLQKNGLFAQAIAIGDGAEKNLSTAIDPATNGSTRDRFYREITLLRRWKDDTPDRLSKAIACPRCKKANKAGAIACTGCGAPFLLDLARGSLGTERITGRLVIAWVVICLMILAFSFAASTMKGVAMTAAILLALASGGLALAAVFRGLKAV